MNAQQLHLTGLFVTLASPQKLAVVFVEGGRKRIRRFERLMTARITWAKPDQPMEGPSPCHLVWHGSSQACEEFKAIYDLANREEAASLFESRGLSHLWQAAITYQPKRQENDL